MDILKLMDKIRDIEIMIKKANSLEERIKLGKKYSKLLDKLDEVMNEELKKLLSQPKSEAVLNKN